MPKEIIEAECSRCRKISYYEKKSWKGREHTYCKKCGKILTETDGGLTLFGGLKAYKEMEKIAQK